MLLLDLALAGLALSIAASLLLVALAFALPVLSRHRVNRRRAQRPGYLHLVPDPAPRQHNRRTVA